MNTNGFLKAHRLSLKKDIELVFSEGNSVNEFPFRFVWHKVKDNTTDVRIAISVSKKKFVLAVDRNTVKRRIREAFRSCFKQNIAILELSSSYNIVIVYTHTEIISQQEIENKVDICLKKIFGNEKNF